MSDLSKSPYPVSSGGETFSYTFKTDSGSEYAVIFKSSTEYLFSSSVDIGDTQILEFQFTLINGSSTQFDNRIKITLIDMLCRTLQDHRNVILYICESKDGKQSARNRLFKNWFEEYSWGDVQRYEGEFKVGDDIEHVSLMVNTHNPYADVIVQYFLKSIDGFQK